MKFTSLTTMIITAAAMAGVVIASGDELTNVRCTPTAVHGTISMIRAGAKMHEERRLRALAKATIKMVTILLFLYTFGNPIDYARILRKGAVVMNIWMLSSISLVTYWKFSKQNSPEGSVSGHFLELGSALKARRSGSEVGGGGAENATEEEESTKDEEEDDNEGGISVSALLGLSLPRFEVDDTSSATSQAGASLVLLDINYEEESEAVLSVVAVKSHSSGNYLGGTVHITN
ncbi:hypothetical protein DFJ58DRAFT_918001 [Suillus subalutaceus]|uniref:uncharacterized protein n=1 Tax=Suillus subalutaceus TaxID=48586 RepID=UPI001B86EAA9|nr:uncharacterized protein DFJ58DRAFT_918001 [Suillus subalutaceus]KAG1834343.1 hypothetical protein DFJ58DRAFT_918001 [Suillus subalutaceus]